MINAGKLHTSTHPRGANGAALTEAGATVTPLATQHNIATRGQNEEEGSTNGEAQPAAIDVDTPDPIDEETPFSPPAVKGNKDANAETANDGSTNGKERTATTDVEA